MPERKDKRIRPVIEEVAREPQPSTTPETPNQAQRQDQIPQGQSPEEQAKVILKDREKTNYKLILFVTVITAIIVGFVAGGVYVYFSGVSKIEQVSPQPTVAPIDVSPTQAPEPNSTPVPEEKIDVSSYKINVLNGSGKIGAAGSVADLLKKAGFSVANIGNAGRYDYKETVVEVKETVPEQVVQMLEDSLGKAYALKKGEVIPQTSGYDVVITVGTD